MSLRFYLENKRGKVLFCGGITHNLGKMAHEAGVYKCLWRPEENSITKARDCIEPLEKGLDLLTNNREKYEQFNPENGWGSYDTLVNVVTDVLIACREYPNALVRASR